MIPAADVMDTVIASDSVLINDNCSADNIMYSLMEPFVQSGVTITVSVEASITDDYYCDPVFNMTVIDGGQCLTIITSTLPICI